VGRAEHSVDFTRSLQAEQAGDWGSPRGSGKKVLLIQLIFYFYFKVQPCTPSPPEACWGPGKTVCEGLGGCLKKRSIHRQPRSRGDLGRRGLFERVECDSKGVNTRSRRAILGDRVHATDSTRSRQAIGGHQGGREKKVLLIQLNFFFFFYIEYSLSTLSSRLDEEYFGLVNFFKVDQLARSLHEGFAVRFGLTKSTQRTRLGLSKRSCQASVLVASGREKVLLIQPRLKKYSSSTL
jgi:hypothetical protein